jgi:hypothetical protein
VINRKILGRNYSRENKNFLRNEGPRMKYAT